MSISLGQNYDVDATKEGITSHAWVKCSAPDENLFANTTDVEIENLSEIADVNKVKDDTEAQVHLADYDRWLRDFVEAVDDEEEQNDLKYLGEDFIFYDIPKIIKEGKDKGYLTKATKMPKNAMDWVPDCTPLHYAAVGGNAHVVETLLKEKEVIVDARNEDNGSTPLHFAAWGGHLDVVKLLINAYQKRGLTANIDDRDNQDMGALQLTAVGTNEDMNREVAAFLVKQGADPSRLVDEDLSLVEIAAVTGNLAIVEYWIEEIAHRRLMSNDEKVIENALRLARYNKHFLIVVTLEDHINCMSKEKAE
jgi:Ankyrin repeats (3 copies)